VRIGDWDTGMWGFINTSCEEVIPPKYDWVGDFSEGMAAVRVGCWRTGKWGFINTSGEEVVPPKYDSVRDFADGLAAVRIGNDPIGRWGLINSIGEEIVPPRYAEIRNFSEGMAAVRAGEWDTGKWGFINSAGEEVVPPKYDGVGDFIEGLATVHVGELRTGKWGFVNSAGEEVVPPIYDVTLPFSEGLAAVLVGGRGTGKLGFVNTSGEEVIPPRFDWAVLFTEGLAAVNEGSAWSFMNRLGELFPIEIELCLPLSYVSEINSDGVAMIRVGDQHTDQRIGFIRVNTDISLPSDHANIYTPDNNRDPATAAQPPSQNEASPESDSPEETAQVFLTPINPSYRNIDELMLRMAYAKFSEFAIAQEPERNSELYALQRYEMLFVPGYLREGFRKMGIVVGSIHWVSMMYDEFVMENDVPIENNYVNFRWSRHIPPENAITGLQGRGAVAEHIIEHNGITYVVLEWEDYGINERVVYEVGWTQYGQSFMATFGGTFTLEEMLSFSYARPIDTWQLRGDAISVSVQGMENVRIFENPDRIALFGGVANEIITIGNGLYRVSAVGFADVDTERVGYRWLICGDVQRFQYVLQPGVYEFRADGFIGQPQLLVQHFTEGDRVAVTDFSADLVGLPTTGFNLTVTQNPEDNDLIIPDLRDSVTSQDELRAAIDTVPENIPTTILEEKYPDIPGSGNVVTTQAELRVAINSAPANTPTTIEIANSFDMTDGVVVIPQNRDITLVSTATGASNMRTLRQTGDQRHFFVDGGRLTLGQNITLCGNAPTLPEGFMAEVIENYASELYRFREEIRIHWFGDESIEKDVVFTEFGVMHWGAEIVAASSEFERALWESTVIKIEAELQELTSLNNSVNGGGVHVSQGGTFTMNDGSEIKNIIHLQQWSCGAGVLVSFGTFNMHGGIISNNIAYGIGGVSVGQSTIPTQMVMTGGTISNNISIHGNSSCVSFAFGTSFSMTGGTISNEIPISGHTSVSHRAIFTSDGTGRIYNSKGWRYAISGVHIGWKCKIYDLAKISPAFMHSE
jgi:hypothetical protein